MLRQLGPFEIVGEIGRGGMGVVYRGLDPAIGRMVAIKVIHLEEESDPQAREALRTRLYREAQAAGILSHPGIVTIYLISEQDALAFIAMEHVNGPSLEALLAAGTAADPPLIQSVLTQTAAALDYAHQRNIIHRDIKPANIMIADDGTVKVCDFGIAKFFGSQHSITRTGTTVGTPYYMAPEQLQGKPITGRADQYSLAVVAYQLLTGARPFTGDTVGTLFYRIMYEQPAPPSRLNTSLPPAVDNVLARALAKDPTFRFASCSEFIQTLLAACKLNPDWTAEVSAPSESPEPEPPEPAPPSEPPAPPLAETRPGEPPPPPPLAASGQRPAASLSGHRLAPFIASALVLLLAALAFLIFRPAPPPPAPLTLGLKVERSGQQLRMSWNPNPQMIKSATQGLVRITDGASRSDVPLDLPGLATGSILYAPVTGQVTFRLRVDLQDGHTLSEAVRFPPGPPPAPTQTKPASE